MGLGGRAWKSFLKPDIPFKTPVLSLKMTCILYIYIITYLGFWVALGNVCCLFPALRCTFQEGQWCLSCGFTRPPSSRSGCPWGSTLSLRRK